MWTVELHFVHVTVLVLTPFINSGFGILCLSGRDALDSFFSQAAADDKPFIWDFYTKSDSYNYH